MSGIDYAILVRNKTRLEQLVERFNTKGQAQFYIESLGGEFAEYEEENARFQESFSLVQRRLSSVLKNKVVERAFLPAFLFNKQQLVVVVGQDGLVANTAKYVGGIPIIAVNPDQARYDGVLLPFTPQDFLPAVQRVVAGRHRVREAALAEGPAQRRAAPAGLQRPVYRGGLPRVGPLPHRLRRRGGAALVLGHHRLYQVGGHGLAELHLQHDGRPWRGSWIRDETPPAPPTLADKELLFVVREAFRSQRTQAGITGRAGGRAGPAHH